MIARISNGASFYGVLAYNGMKVGSGEGEVIACNNMKYSSRIMQSGEIPLCLHTFDGYVELTKFVDSLKEALLNKSLG